MNIYKKNPDVKGVICINGKNFDDNTVVVGTMWAPFANPNTFPGIPPRLVQVDYGSLSKKQQEFLAGVVPTEEKPRHMGPITSESFQTVNVVDPAATPGADPIVEESKETDGLLKDLIQEKKDEQEQSVVAEKPVVAVKSMVLKELFDEKSLIETFQGITEKNAKKVLDSFKNLDDLVSSGNAVLRKAGIASTYFTRIREKAMELKKMVGQK